MIGTVFSRRTTLMHWGVAVLVGIGVAGCSGSSQPTSPAEATPTYPGGWKRTLYSDAFWVVSGPLAGDRDLMEWFQKGLRRSCEAWSRTEHGMQFSVVWARSAGGTGINPPPTVEETFSMIGRRSADMKEVETAGAAGSGFGEGKMYEGEKSRLFVRVGMVGSVVYILMVRGDAKLDTHNQYLRAFFDGFEPVAR